MTVSTIARGRTRSRRARVGAGLYTPRPMAPREAPRPPRGRRRTKLARELTAARLRAGLTQAQLGEKFGVDGVTVRRWELALVEPRGARRRLVDAFILRHRAPE